MTSGALPGQEHRAVRPHLVGERVLEFVTALRQAVLDDDFHARLAERAALLLVGQYALQRGDLGGEIGDVFLRGVDDGEPLVQLLQMLAGVRRGLLQRIAEPVRHRLEPLVDRGLQLRLAVAEHPDHGFEALPGGALRLRQFGHDGGLRLRRIAAAPEHDNQRRDRGQSHDNGHNREERQHLGHRVTLCDSQAA